MKKSEKSNTSPPCMYEILHPPPPLFLVVIFPYVPPLVSQPLPPPGNYCTVPDTFVSRRAVLSRLLDSRDWNFWGVELVGQKQTSPLFV